MGDLAQGSPGGGPLAPSRAARCAARAGGVHFARTEHAVRRPRRPLAMPCRGPLAGPRVPTVCQAPRLTHGQGLVQPIEHAPAGALFVSATKRRSRCPNSRRASAEHSLPFACSWALALRGLPQRRAHMCPCHHVQVGRSLHGHMLRAPGEDALLDLDSPASRRRAPFDSPSRR